MTFRSLGVAALLLVDVFEKHSLGADPGWSPKNNQTVAISIYSDFLCPFCRKTAETLKDLRQVYGDSLQIIFKHNPSVNHIGAQQLHEAAAAAAAQGKFWDLHDRLFAADAPLSEAQVRGMASGAGLDMPSFDAFLKDPLAKETVNRDMAEARAYGVRATPTMFVNGQRFVGAPEMASLKRLIDKELGLTVPVKLTSASSPVRGEPGAAVTIWIFSDFQCPFCVRALPPLEQILQEFPGSVRLVFKHFPLSFHPDAALAHEAAIAAGEQRQFWAMHDALFRQQANLKLPDLIRAGDQLELKGNDLSEALRSRRYRARVEADIEEGRQAGVEGTPTMFINGRILVGAQPIEELRRIVLEELRKVGKDPSK